MRNFTLCIVALISLSFSQEIIKANKIYTPKTDMVVFTEVEFNKLDSLISDTLQYKKKIQLLKLDVSISDSIAKGLSTQIENLQRQNRFLCDKDTLFLARESLLNQKVDVYKGLFTDVQKEMDKNKGKGGFFNNTFWFGAGAVVGIVTLYVSSLVISNIK